MFDDYIKFWTDFSEKVPSARETIAGLVVAAHMSMRSVGDADINGYAEKAVKIADAILAITRPKT